MGSRRQPSPLSPIPATPHLSMTLSRSPSPVPAGGWSSPGLDINTSGRSSPATASPGFYNGHQPSSWESSASRRTMNMGGYPAFETKNQGFFQRHMRRISSNLPRFHTSTNCADKEKRQQSRWAPTRAVPLGGRLRNVVGRMGRKAQLRALLGLLLLLSAWMLCHSSLLTCWRRASWLGGGKKFVILLGANVGGGVMEWKGAREWAIERDSLRNKKRYSAEWGYELEVVDMSTKKRYAHEWRESWEKVDFLRNAFKKYPQAEWVWWLDLNSYIMEPHYSLQSHMFDHLEQHVYRDINEYNPLNISHPLTDGYLDEEMLSPIGDGRPDSIHLVLSQDCSGFNLGSFFVRRSAWTDRLLDVWWDPVAYEQKHMEWAHKEQDALEQLYRTQAWIRAHVAFTPQRMINSFPPGACSDKGNDTRVHYNQTDRDFLVNMAGCEWGRDCWGEMYNYRELSYYLNRNWWERFKEDLVAHVIFKITGRQLKL